MLRYSSCRHDADEILEVLTDVESSLRAIRDALLTLRRDEIPVEFSAEDIDAMLDDTKEQAREYTDMACEENEREHESELRSYRRAV